YPSAVHAYEPHDYAAKVAVVGAGMAAATEWLNALAAGAEVVSIRRREPLRRPLNVPRPFFSKRGLATYHAASPESRAATLRELSNASYPPGAAWDLPLRAAEAEGRFRVEPSPNGSHQVIAATGFRKGFHDEALLAALALQRWWAIELVALMLGIGLLLDALLYDRVLDYQPAWLAVPLGALELGLVYGAMRWLDLMAPLRWALVLYAIGWLGAQLFGHALFPRVRLEYAEAGGELGRRGALTAVAVAAIVVS